MKELQFSAVVLMTILTLTLTLPMLRRVVWDPMSQRVRMMLAGGTMLMGLQFLLQYLLDLRALGVTQAVTLNLLLFIPASGLFNLAILILLRQGHIRRFEWMVVLEVWGITAVLLFIAYLVADKPFFSDTFEMRWAEIIGSVLFALMQVFNYYMQLLELRKMRRSLADYYDSDMSEVVHWMKLSMVLLMLMGVFIPVVIFGTSLWLVLYGLLFFGGVYYLVINFMFYMVSNDAKQVRNARQSAEETMEMVDGVLADQDTQMEEHTQHVLSEEERQRVEAAVNRWLAEGNYLNGGITIQNAADEMGVPRYLLSLWLKTTDQRFFSAWMSYLRIEEAKRQMTAHPNWSNDIIAEKCGFSSRSYFQTIFRKQTGMTPMQYHESLQK